MIKDPIGRRTTSVSFFNKVFAPIALIILLVFRIFTTLDTSLNFTQLLSYFLIPVISCFYLFFSTPSKDSRINLRTIIALILSYGSLLLIKTEGFSFTVPQKILILGTTFFYLTITVLGYFSLGKSLSITPELKEIKTKFLYRELRHPLYSSYLHIFLINLIVLPNMNNLLALICLFLGLYIRATEEETLLRNVPAYEKYYSETKNKFFSLVISTPAIILLLVITFTSIPKNEKVTVQIAYPVLSVSPLIFDDWSSIFVVNHIYPRLFRDNDRPWIPHVLKNYNLSCNDQNCTQQKIIFEFQPVNGCNKNLSIPQIKDEFKQIITSKTWILPSSRECTSGPESLCYVFKKTDDVLSRLENLYMRFGWSLDKELDKIEAAGLGPYCLTNIQFDPNKNIVSGDLIAVEEKHPSISFFTSQNSEESFDISLYGTAELLNPRRVNIDSHTPLAYYLVWNKKYLNRSSPIDDSNIFKIIENHFFATDLIKSYPLELKTKFTPIGDRPFSNDGTSRRFRLVIPSYIPNCEKLKKDIGSHNENIVASCEDTTIFIDKKIRQKDHDWDAFISPLTPGYPTRDAIRSQYFSAESKESWTYDSSSPERLYKLIGLGSSLITVEKSKYCNLIPRFLGMADVVISDFRQCAGFFSQLKRFITKDSSSNNGK